jgi:HSP20 family protein
MALVPWKSRRQERGEMMPWQGLRSEMDRLFDQFFREPFGGRGLASGGWMPSVDVEDHEKEVVVKAELPGMKAEDIQLSVAGNMLTISGEKEEKSEKKEKGWYQQERHFGSFRRDVMLPTEVDGQKVSAEYSSGVLTVTLKKSPAATAKRIEVKAT